MDQLQSDVLRIASRCGDCGKLFEEDTPCDYVYVRLHPARLICLDCKLKEEGRGP